MSCCDHDCQPAETGGRYRRILWVALGLNATMFLIEIVILGTNAWQTWSIDSALGLFGT